MSYVSYVTMNTFYEETMAKKRTTLPRNFDELLRAGDIEGLRVVFDKCELDAVGGYNKGTALHFYGIPGELISWLVEQGANIEAENSYGRTPLYVQASSGSDNVKLLLDLGANIEAADHYGETPIHIAAGFHKADTVRLLIERGKYTQGNRQRDDAACLRPRTLPKYRYSQNGGSCKAPAKRGGKDNARYG